MHNMSRRELDTKELKMCQLDVLKEVHNYCVNHNLKYYMIYGTLLGAVRHHGYIPWDDDIDIAMPREDYEVFIPHYNRESSHISRCIHYSLDSSYYLDFAKVYNTRTELTELVHNPKTIGVYIDVFPIDKMPDNSVLAEKQLSQIAFYEKLLRKHNRTGSIGKWKKAKSLIRDFQRLLVTESRYEVIKKIDSLGSQFIRDTTSHVSIAVGGCPGLKDYVPYEWYGEPQLMQFETEMFYAPAKAKELLTQWYGKYMTLPPVEERQPHHSFNAYWR